MHSSPRIYHRTLFLPGPAGRLEASLWTSDVAEPKHAGLVCHPHPLFGGTLHNKVAFQAAKTLHNLGMPVLRFNFRGAGLSEGVHDRGRGEQDDVRSALDFLGAEFPRIPVVLAGFSFGSWVGLRVGAEDPRVTHFIGLGIPVNDSDFSYLRDCRKPKLFVVGGRDKYAARELVESVVASLAEPKRLVFVDDADHFFAGKLDQVDRAITEWWAAQS